MRLSGLLVLGFLAVVGCSGDGSPGDPGAESSPPTASPSVAAPSSEPPFPWESQAPGPELVPLADPGTTDATPRPLAGEPDPDRVAELAVEGTDQAAALSFAVAFGQLQADVRSEREHAVALDPLVSADLDDDVRLYLEQDYWLQRAIGGTRRLLANRPAWFRAEVLGDPRRPTRVNVQMAWWMRGLGLDMWNMTRVDVAREDEGWRVVDFSWGATAEQPQDYRAPDIRMALHGPGWQRFQ